MKDLCLKRLNDERCEDVSRGVVGLFGLRGEVRVRRVMDLLAQKKISRGFVICSHANSVDDDYSKYVCQSSILEGYDEKLMQQFHLEPLRDHQRRFAAHLRGSEERERQWALKFSSVSLNEMWSRQRLEHEYQQFRQGEESKGRLIKDEGSRLDCALIIDLDSNPKLADSLKRLLRNTRMLRLFIVVLSSDQNLAEKFANHFQITFSETITL